MEQKKGDQRKIAENYFGLAPHRYGAMMCGAEGIHDKVLDKLGLERIRGEGIRKAGDTNTTTYEFKEKE